MLDGVPGAAYGRYRFRGGVIGPMGGCLGPWMRRLTPWVAVWAGLPMLHQ